MNKKRKFTIISIIALVSLVFALIFLILQFQPIIKNQKYTLITSVDGTKKAEFIFCENGKCYITEQKEIYPNGKSVVKFKEYNYYQHGNNFYSTTGSEIVINNQKNNFTNGLFTIRIKYEGYDSTSIFVLLKPLWFFAFSIFFLASSIPCVIYIVKELKNKKFNENNTPLNELEKGD